jgi:hypothetical protein
VFKFHVCATCVLGVCGCVCVCVCVRFALATEAYLEDCGNSRGNSSSSFAIVNSVGCVDQGAVMISCGLEDPFRSVGILSAGDLTSQEPSTSSSCTLLRAALFPPPTPTTVPFSFSKH